MVRTPPYLTGLCMPQCASIGVRLVVNGLRASVCATAVGFTCTNLERHQPVLCVTVETEEVRITDWILNTEKPLIEICY